MTATEGFRDDTPITYDSEVSAGLSQELNVSETALFPRHLVSDFVGFVVLFALATLCGIFRWSRSSVSGLRRSLNSLLGLFIAILLIDTFPTPMSYAPLMLLAIQGGMPIWVVFIASSLASMSGGLLGYSMGRLVGLPKRLEAWLEDKHPDQFTLLKEHGAWGVAAVAALPLPFALGTDCRGHEGPTRRRAPGMPGAHSKTAFYIALIMGASPWEVGNARISSRTQRFPTVAFLFLGPPAPPEAPSDLKNLRVTC